MLMQSAGAPAAPLLASTPNQFGSFAAPGTSTPHLLPSPLLSPFSPLRLLGVIHLSLSSPPLSLRPSPCPFSSSSSNILPIADGFQLAGLPGAAGWEPPACPPPSSPTGRAGSAQTPAPAAPTLSVQRHQQSAVYAAPLQTWPCFICPNQSLEFRLQLVSTVPCYGLKDPLQLHLDFFFK